jgi:hypothetical protein
MCQVLNFTLCSHDDKKLISGVFLQPAKNLGLFVILQPAKDLNLFVILSEARNLFFHFLKQEILRLYSFRTTNGFEFLISLITIDLALE